MGASISHFVVPEHRVRGSYFWNEISRAKTQMGHGYSMKWLEHDIDGPLIRVHKITLNNGGRVQF